MPMKFYIEQTDTGHISALAWDSREQAQAALDHMFRGKSREYRRVVEREAAPVVAEKKIASARITRYPKNLVEPLPEVWVKLEGEKVEKKLFSFYPDEINFVPGEFIGKTPKEAGQLKYRKDLSYLRGMSL